MTAHEISQFLAREFPQSTPAKAEIEQLEDGFVRVRRVMSDADVRPGGTVSGPAMMALADHAMYIAVLAMIGPVALAVTTNLTINFLRKPSLGDMIAEARILKLGRRLAVGEVTLFSDGRAEPVAHSTLTYSIPPQ